MPETDRDLPEESAVISKKPFLSLKDRVIEPDSKMLKELLTMEGKLQAYNTLQCSYIMYIYMHVRISSYCTCECEIVCDVRQEHGSLSY